MFRTHTSLKVFKQFHNFDSPQPGHTIIHIILRNRTETVLCANTYQKPNRIPL